MSETGVCTNGMDGRHRYEIIGATNVRTRYRCLQCGIIRIEGSPDPYTMKKRREKVLVGRVFEKMREAQAWEKRRLK